MVWHRVWILQTRAWEIITWEIFTMISDGIVRERTYFSGIARPDKSIHWNRYNRLQETWPQKNSTYFSGINFQVQTFSETSWRLIPEKSGKVTFCSAVLNYLFRQVQKGTRSTGFWFWYKKGSNGKKKKLFQHVTLNSDWTKNTQTPHTFSVSRRVLGRSGVHARISLYFEHGI